MTLEVLDLRVRLGEQEGLRGVSLQLGRGEIVGLIGPPESGKTTLFKSLAGLVEPESGAIVFDGERQSRAQPGELERWQGRIGMSFQNDALFDSLTVFENVAFPLLRRGVVGPEADASVQGRIAEVGLAHAMDKLPSEISGGMRKRVGIARAMIIEPRIGLFDDPTAGLDPVTSATILGMVRHLARELGSATMVISNDLPALFPICDRVMMLHGGEVVYDGTVEDVLASPRPEVVQFVTGADEGPL